MRHLLDSSVLIPALIGTHAHHLIADDWIKDKEVATCPTVELAFLRVAIGNYGADQAQARKILETFKQRSLTGFVAVDLSPLQTRPFPTVKKSTDWYLAELAQKHGMVLAAIDFGMEHPATIQIPLKHPPDQRAAGNPVEADE